MISALLLLAAQPILNEELFPTGPREWELLEGAWTVDLATEPQVTYTQPMVIDIEDNGRVTGSFYNTPISSGRYGSSFGRQCIAFVTSDGAGDYQHSACLVDGRMVGQSWAEHRQFLLPWSAERTAP
jgi:hypothetical protein